MTNTWDGRPQNPEEDGLHYITDGVAFWLAGPQKWALLNRGRRERPEWLAAQPWAEYRGPCPTSAELETRVAAARREGIEAALRVCRAVAMSKIHGSTYHQVVTMLEDDIRALLTEGER